MPDIPLSKPLMAALQSGDTIHLLDHLIPLCDLFGIPLLVDSYSSYRLAEQYYPPIELILIDNSKYLFYINKFNFFFLSDKYTSSVLESIYNVLFDTKKIFFYCPHGNSDKGFINPDMCQLTFHNLSLIYGEQMQCRIHKMGLFSQFHTLITMGNLRKRFYKKYQTFFTEKLNNNLTLPIEREYTFLYAPSWKDLEDSSSFFIICKYLIEHISSKNHLIIKIHPHLITHHLGYVTHICEKYKDKKNIEFIIDNPLIYPLLQYIDIYLGDISSIGYDFLFFNRPMFFFDTRMNPPSESKTLFQCGIEVPSQYFKNPYPFMFSKLQENLKKSTIRKEMYNLVFAEDPKDDEFKQNIINAYYSLQCLNKSPNG